MPHIVIFVGRGSFGSIDRAVSIAAAATAAAEAPPALPILLPTFFSSSPAYSGGVGVPSR
jgi:hypothetical protein